VIFGPIRRLIMLVSTIIANSLLLADVPNVNFYTAAESLFAVQLSWEEVYAFLCSNNDDYFVNSYYCTPASDPAVTFDANREYVWLLDTTNTTDFPDASNALYSAFYRLRLIQYQGYGGTIAYYPVNKMSIENFGNTQNTPAYRFEGKYIAIYDPAQFTNFCFWYYPRPITLTTTTDLQYPYNMIPEIMAYQAAIEIRRKQKADTAPWEKRKQELLMSMSAQISRDDSHGEPIKNQFGQGFAPYI
jgi:hypothetical protein